jgi:hypothetical protein
MVLAIKQKRLPIDFYIPKILIIFFLNIIGTISILFGCATIEEPQYVSQPDVIDVVPIQTFDLPTLLTGNNRPSIDVQLTKSGEVSKVSPENAVSGVFIGFIYGSFWGVRATGGSTSLPLLAIAAAAGGTIGATLGAVEGGINSNDHSIVTKAFQETNFSAQIQNVLEKSLSSYFLGQPDGITEIQLLILGFGFSATGFDNLGFYCEADIQVKHARELVFQDFIFGSAQKRSEDMPPPRSASLHDFAKGDGKLMHTMLEEASEIVSAIVLKRLKVPYEATSHHYNIPDDKHLLRVQREYSGSSNQ